MDAPKNAAVHLRALSAADAAIMHTWRNDPAIAARVVAPVRFVSPETEKEWNEQARKDHERGVHIRLAICLPEDGRLVGSIDLNRIDQLNRTAFTGIMIGDTTVQGRGLAKAAYAQLLPYAFGELGLHALYARILDDNDASQRLYRSLGFRQDGLQRGAIFKGGQHHDLLWFSLLAAEYTPG